MAMKRLFDIVLALVAGVLLSVPLLLIALMVRLTSSGSALYWSHRVGRNNSIFLMPKFRTMRIGTPPVATHLLSDPDEYLTPIGFFLRKSSLDELPQLWNILCGEMSLVGPRAEWSRIVVDYEKKIPSYHLRHLVKPGITGWAQVNYRYGSDLDDAIEKLRYDLYYIKNYSLVLDIEILLKTILKVCSLGGK